MAMIEAHGLSKRFGYVAAVDNLSLEAAEGEVLGFLGPNGAGKTTTIRMLAGMIAPTSGYGEIAGLRTDTAGESLHEVIGLLTEAPGFYDKLSAYSNLEFFARFYPGIDAGAQIEKYMNAMGLWDRRGSRVGTYSKGMKQRLALARAMLHEPKVLLLDEPTAGLDPDAAQEVRGLVQRLSAEGRTIFLSTHNLTEAEQLCHRVAVVRTRLLAFDTAQNLRDRFFRREIVVELADPNPAVAESFKSLASVQDMRVEGNNLVFTMREPERDRPDLVRAIVDAGGRILNVSERNHPLEEVYLRLVHEEEAHEP